MKYLVEVKEICTAYVEVEAFSKEKAEEIAIGHYFADDSHVMYDGTTFKCNTMAMNHKDAK